MTPQGWPVVTAGERLRQALERPVIAYDGSKQPGDEARRVAPSESGRGPGRCVAAACPGRRRRWQRTLGGGAVHGPLG